MSDELTELCPVALRPGRALRCERDGTLYVGRRFEIHRSHDNGRSWHFVCKIPTPPPQRFLQTSRLACRLLRQEIRAMVALSDGSIVAANRAGVYNARAGTPVLSKSQLPNDGTSPSPPMTISRDDTNRVLWGEYNSRYLHGKPIRIYASVDAGQSFEIVHTFAAGEVRHIHNIIPDAASGCFWVLTGDLDHESGIGRLAWDFTSFDWLVRGSQAARTVDLFDLGDSLLYAMDSGLEPNFIIHVDKASGQLERGQPIDSCCIYACRCGNSYLISTSVTRVAAHRANPAAIWRSSDGDRWNKVLTAAKDIWHPARFQYGSFVLPRGASQHDTLLLSGQALRGLDGRAFTAQLK